MTFKKNKYTIFKNILSPQFASFLTGYSLLKRKALDTMLKDRYISPFETALGKIKGDEQVKETYCHYGDIAMETLLQVLKPELEKKIKLKLVPTYSYQRIYKKGDILKRHIDRNSCEISATLNLGGDPWPIYVENDSKNIYYKKGEYRPGDSKGKKINLNVGDLMIYRGCEVEHWREPFLGTYCVQVFLHYNIADQVTTNVWDGRPHPGLPEWYVKRKIHND